MIYLQFFLQLFSFVYTQRKDLKKHLTQFYNYSIVKPFNQLCDFISSNPKQPSRLIRFYESNFGKRCNQLGVILSLVGFTFVCFVSAVIYIIKHNLSNISVLVGTGLFMVCLVLIYGIAYLHKDVLYYKKA